MERCFTESNKDYLYRMPVFEVFVTLPCQDGPTFVSFDHLEHRRTGMFGCIWTNVANIASLVGQRSTFDNTTSSERTWTNVVVL